MTIVSYIINLLFLFLSLQTANFLRLNIPIGSAVSTAPSLTLGAYVLLAMVWGMLFLLQHLLQNKLRLRGEILQIAIQSLVFSVVEYLIISNENASFSRLFLAYFAFANLLGLFASRRLIIVIQAHKKWLIDLARKLWKTYNSLNETAYRYYLEAIASIVVGIVWASYILKMGLTVASDGTTYLRIGLRFATNGEFLPGTNPPFYPLVISATSFITQFPADGAALVSAACLVIFFLLFAILLRRFSRNSIANMLLIFLLATFDDFILLFLTAKTEPIYTVFLIANFFLLVKHYFNPKWIYLIGAALLTVFAMVTRFIGITMGAMLILYALFLSEPQKPLNFRVRKYILPALLTFLPFLFLIWLDVNIREAVFVYLAEAVGRRPLTSFFIGNFSLTDMTIRFLTAFWEIAGQPYVIFALALLLFIFLFRSKVVDQKGRELLGFNLFFLLGYLILTIATFTITVHVPTQSRYWMPLFFFAFLVMAQTTDLVFRKNSLIFARSIATRTVVLILLLALPVYTLIYQSLGVENILVDRVRDARANPMHPVQEGFNLSPTSGKFRNFFEEISNDQDQNTIVVVEGDLNGTTMVFESDYEIAESFLFKSRLISGPNVTGFKFLDIQVLDQYLSYYYDGRYKELHLIIPRQYTISELIPQLEQPAQNERGVSGVFFIINEEWFNLFASELFGDEMNKLQLSAQIEPYLVFELPPASFAH